MTLLGAIGVKIVLTNTYLRYVNPWMKWPILAASLVLFVVSIRHLFVRTEETANHTLPIVTWLLLLPVLVLFVASPPELGSYAAERRLATNAPRPKVQRGLDTPSDGAVNMTLGDFMSLAEWEPVRSVTSHSVALTGFVSKGPGNAWYVTRMAITCCAADALAYRVQVLGAPAPQRDQWIQVTGRYVDPQKPTPRLNPAIAAQDVRFVVKPKNTYE